MPRFAALLLATSPTRATNSALPSPARLSGPGKRLIALLLIMLCANAHAGKTSEFPQPASLTPAVEFWKRVYTEVDDSTGFIHDDRKLGIVYQRLQLTGKPGKAQRRQMRSAIARWRKALLSLASATPKNLDQYQRKVQALWGKHASAKTLKAAAKRLRFQRGQANKFRAGIIRAGAWQPAIRKILKDLHLPLDLAELPHVESSFNPRARSHVGASGMWQFTRSTGRRFLRIDGVVDERLHPLKASKAAARLLQHNYSVLQSWPLALTAYNHGLSGMRRAVKKIGSNDIGLIVKRYNGRLFGFASRNFYAAFLAARAVSADYQSYFGKLKRQQPRTLPHITTQAWLPAKRVAHTLNTRLDTLRTLNPSLQRSVWQGLKLIPKDFDLKLPAGKSLTKKLRHDLRRLTSREGQWRQKPDRLYIVRRGDSLSSIARRYHTSVRTLMTLNRLRSSHRIRIGQRLKLPGGLQLASKHHSPTPRSRPGSGATSTSASVTNHYRVRRGDTLSQIAKRTGISQKRLMQLNNLHSAGHIRAGQALLLAAGPASTTAATQATEANRRTPDNNPTPAETTEALSRSPVASGAPSLAASEPPNAQTTLQTDDQTNTEAPTETPAEIVATNETESDEQPVEPQPELAADPADYEVDSKGRITVQSVETLGHYADWLGIATQSLRRLNHLSRHQRVYIGQRLKLSFKKVSPEQFVTLRKAYQQRLQSDYFEQHRITGSKPHTLRPGENLWSLAVARYNIPLWLLRQYNPDIALKTALAPGSRLQIPLVEKI